MASRAVVFRPINTDDVSNTPFEANTTFKISNVTPGSNVIRFGIHNNQITPISASQLTSDNARNVDGTYQTPIWKAIDHLYYKPEFKYESNRTFEHYNSRYTEKNLFYSCSIIGIPYIRTGENIKRTSFTISSTGSLGIDKFNLYDDKYGNLRDKLIDSSSFVSKKNLVGYWGFNDEFRHFELNFGTLGGNYTKGVETKRVYPSLKNKASGIGTLAYKVKYDKGITTTGTYQSGSGIGAGFVSGSNAYMVTENDEKFNFRNDQDFAISFWCKLPEHQAYSSSKVTSNPIITKRGTERVPVRVTKNGKQIVQLENQNLTRTRFPFDISVTNHESSYPAGRLLFSRSQGIDTLEVTSSTYVTASGWHHIVCQKSGSSLPWGDYSYLQIFVDGNKESTIDDAFNFERYSNTMNPSHLIFGALNINPADTTKLSGSIDEVRIYDRALGNSEVLSLANNHYYSSSAYQSSVAGNVFYRSGQVVISSPLPKYHYALQGTYDVEYKSARTIYENEVLVKVPKADCNVSMNPSIRKPKSQFIQNQFTGSAWKPYITTIGLYNESAQLIAVAKLGRAVQKRDDVDMNFIIRWDY